MKKKYKVLISIVLIITLFFGAFNLRPKADSGWDSSYDGGGSWDSGSSWDSDWSSNDSWSSNGTSHYSGSGEFHPMSFLFILTIIIIIIIIVSRSKNTQSGTLNAYNELSDEELAKYGINKEQFKQMVFDKYVAIQEAWMNFDYDKLRVNLTDELYNTYMMQLDALKLKNQKNIMSDFDKINVKITNIRDENGLLNVSAYLRVTMYDYVVDGSGSVVRGNDKRKIDIEYIVTFVKSSKDEHGDTICPNCGAKIDAVANGKCDYCGSTVVVDAKDFVLSKKTCIGQR